MIAGHDLLTLAELWITEASEAEWRSAVSRARYLVGGQAISAKYTTTPTL
jgi:hypothetical protein